MQGGETVLGGRLHRGQPERAAADAGDPVLGVDAHLVQRGRPHDHDVGQVLRGERSGVVAGALRATRRPAATAARTTLTTSAGSRGTATAAGRRSTAALQAKRAAS